MAKALSGSTTIAVSGDGVLANFVVTLPTNAASPYQHLVVATISGSVTLTPPAATLLIVLVPPTGSILTKTLKGIAGDTGIPLSLTQPTMLSVATTPGTFVITANGIENIDVYYF